MRLTATPVVNAAIARARSLPELIGSLPPGMAAQLEAKPLLASRSPPAVLVATAIAYVSTKYGLGWDDTLDAAIAGAILLVVGYIMRAITNQPIAGVVAAPADAPSAVPPVAAILVLAVMLCALSACAGGTLQQPVPVAAVQDPQVALKTYQAALGTMDQALAANPALQARADALAAKAAPYVAMAQAGTAQASAAPSLAALAAELLIEAAPYITVKPNA